MVELSPDPTNNQRPIQKWGAAAAAGWQALPDVLLKNQAKLGLSSTELVLLINILSHWWYPEQLPFPRVTTFAKRMGVTPRTVQRAFESLVAKGLVERRKQVEDEGRERSVIDPKGLVEKLKTLAERDPSFLARQQKRDAYYADTPF